MKLPTFFAALISISLTACAQVALRTAMLRSPGTQLLADRPIQFILQLAQNPFLIGGIIIYGGSILLWLYVLSQTPVSVAYPLSAIGFVLTAVFALIFLNEDLTLLRSIGILTICVGVFMVSRSV